MNRGVRVTRADAGSTARAGHAWILKLVVRPTAFRGAVKVVAAGPSRLSVRAVAGHAGRDICEAVGCRTRRVGRRLRLQSEHCAADRSRSEAGGRGFGRSSARDRAGRRHTGGRRRLRDRVRVGSTLRPTAASTSLRPPTIASPTTAPRVSGSASSGRASETPTRSLSPRTAPCTRWTSADAGSSGASHRTGPRRS
jgi:hypothetical protein